MSEAAKLLDEVMKPDALSDATQLHVCWACCGPEDAANDMPYFRRAVAELVVKVLEEQPCRGAVWSAGEYEYESGPCHDIHPRAKKCARCQALAAWKELTQ
jgi:hypothetical protein